MRDFEVVRCGGSKQLFHPDSGVFFLYRFTVPVHVGLPFKGLSQILWQAEDGLVSYTVIKFQFALYPLQNPSVNFFLRKHDRVGPAGPQAEDRLIRCGIRSRRFGRSLPSPAPKTDLWLVTGSW